MEDSTKVFIPTKCSAIKGLSDEHFNVVEYQSHKKKAKKKTEIEKVNTAQETQIINIKKVKHEIIKFGMSGFNVQRKEEAKVQLAVKLGAKPPKNKYKNYKELMEEKKKMKLQEKSQLSFQQLGKDELGKCIVKTKTQDHKKKKQKSNILDSYGKVKIKLKQSQK